MPLITLGVRQFNCFLDCVHRQTSFLERKTSVIKGRKVWRDTEEKDGPEKRRVELSKWSP